MIDHEGRVLARLLTRTPYGHLAQVDDAGDALVFLVVLVDQNGLLEYKVVGAPKGENAQCGVSHFEITGFHSVGLWFLVIRVVMMVMVIVRVVMTSTVMGMIVVGMMMWWNLYGETIVYLVIVVIVAVVAVCVSFARRNVVVNDLGGEKWCSLVHWSPVCSGCNS